ncbi:MAG: hypothetical protein WD358_09505 [Nitriliruptoraceae bacterium]
MSRDAPRRADAGGRSGPAFYAATGGTLADCWTLLHPPYTAWHLGYVAIGAALAPQLDPVRLLATLTAFFLAVGIAAHALDELQGRPLGTSIPSGVLWSAAIVGLAGAAALGVVGIGRVGWGLAVFIAVGVWLVPAYNLEWFGGRVHTDVGFAVAWGAFPVLTAYFAQAERLDAVALAGAAGAYALTHAQRALSTPAREVRRRIHRVDVRWETADGQLERAGKEFVLQPLERALRAMSWAVVTLAIGMVVAQMR